MEWLRARRGVFIVLMVITLALVGITGGLRYVCLQNAEDADAFRSLLPDGHGRYIAAAIIDLLFAIAYGLGALSMSIRNRLSVAGGVGVLVGALADELENVWMLRNIGREATVDDGAINLMRTFGTIKWVFIVAGVLLLFTAYTRNRRDRVKE